MKETTRTEYFLSTFLGAIIGNLLMIALAHYFGW